MTRPVLCAERNGRLAESYLEGFPMEINLWSSLAASTVWPLLAALGFHVRRNAYMEEVQSNRALIYHLYLFSNFILVNEVSKTAAHDEKASLYHLRHSPE